MFNGLKKIMNKLLGKPEENVVNTYESSSNTYSVTSNETWFASAETNANTEVAPVTEVATSSTLEADNAPVEATTTVDPTNNPPVGGPVHGKSGLKGGKKSSNTTAPVEATTTVQKGRKSPKKDKVAPVHPLGKEKGKSATAGKKPKK
jgi:hypothetical protein